MQLENLLLGSLQEDEALGLEQHLERCPRCAAKAETLRPHDTLLDAMRHYQPPAADDSALARRMVERLGPRAVDSREVESLENEAANADDASRHDLFHRLAKLLDPPAAKDPAPPSEPATPDDPAQYDFLAPPETADEIGRLGNYRVLGVLGAGGMGVVFLAEDLDLKRRVALKAMHPALAASAGARDRFMREAQAVAAIDHDNVVAIHQVGKDRGIPFLAMTLLRGQSLDDRILPGYPLPLADVLRIGRETAAGLAAAHERGLVHRDVKPANVWLEEPGGRVKLLDFGLARPVDSDTHFTRLGAVIGTPAFMSPEQAKGQTLDPRSDLFSLGSMLYLMSTGEPPFIGVDHAAVLAAIDHEQPEPPHALRPELPAAFSDLVMQLLAKDRAARPASAAAVVERLRDIEQGAEPRAKPVAKPALVETPPVAARPFSLGWFGAIAAALLLLVGGGIYAAAIIVTEWSNGKLIVETDDKNVEVVVKQEGGQPLVEIVERGSKRTYSLRPGEYEIDVTVQEGEKRSRFFTRKLTITQGDSRVLDVRLELAKAATPAVEPVPRTVDVAQAALAASLPLQEWLKGRQVITVAQDGSGDYRSIQTALKALQAGQVVKVLDKGPYRERVYVTTLPPDVGLVSEVGTRIEFETWGRSHQVNNPKVASSSGCRFNGVDGFRLSGIEIACPPLDPQANFSIALTIETGGPITVESCRVLDASRRNMAGVERQHGPQANRFNALNISCFSESGTFPPAYFQVRENYLEGNVNYFGPPQAIAMRRNLIADGSVLLPQYPTDFEFRENVLFGVQGLRLRLGPDFTKTGQSRGKYRIVNNFFDIRDSIAYTYYRDDPTASLPSDVRIVNNLFRSAQRKGVDFFDAGLRADAVAKWAVEHNAYREEPARAEGVFSFPPQKTDRVSAPQFLSEDFQDDNCLRLSPTDPLANGGAAGDLPGYIGPLPPGPAPEQGDWFTRLLSFARASSGGETAKPLVISEPPPLAQWLQGRKIITVALDGSGDFKTLAEALEASADGQVIKLLDKGPHPMPALVTFKRDTGLISEVGARIELDEWRQRSLASDARSLVSGFSFTVLGGLRVSGIHFQAPEVPPNAISLQFASFMCRGEVTMEGCVVQCGPADLSAFSPQDARMTLFSAASFYSAIDGPPVRICLRENRFSGTANVFGMFRFRQVLLENNVFQGRGRNAACILPTEVDQAIVRHNVFLGSKGIWFAYGMRDVSQSNRYLFANNVFQTQQSPIWHHPERSFGEKSAPPRDVTIRNNVFMSQEHRGVDFITGDDLLHARQHWRVGENVYTDGAAAPTGISLGTMETDRVVERPFLSIDPANRDYLRIAADSPLATSGAGGDLPDYIGAVPPGSAPKADDWLLRLLADNDSRSFAVVEPPPLAKWLEGREIVTVAQDGSGKFRTIRDGLLNAKPGQVVKVLDKGPYRERWSLTLSDDIGLVSEVGTRIEFPELLKMEGNDEQPPRFRYRGSAVVCPGDFRLAGFEFAHPGFSEDAFGGEAFIVWAHGSATIEDCRFADAPGRLPMEANAISPRPWYRGLVVISHDHQPSGAVTVRQCRADGLQIEGKPSSVLVERNWIVSADLTAVTLVLNRGDVVVRHNVIQGDTGIHYFTGNDNSAPGADEMRVLVANNLLDTRVAAFAVPARERSDGSPLPASVRIENNIMRSQNGEFILFPARDLFDFAARHWQVGHNYLNKTPGAVVPQVFVIAKHETDVVGEMPFLAEDVGNINYLRIPADSKPATSGAGGNLPGHVGPFLPGPAPPAGDWFTRLLDAIAATHVGMKEPPPLAKWLEGRKIITVAQDGSGDFKTIPEALAACADGQVIKLLDKGPYPLPAELTFKPGSGLISEVGTRVELADWAKQLDLPDGKTQYRALQLNCPAGVRLAGLQFESRKPPADSSLPFVLGIWGGGEIVLDRCRLRAPNSNSWIVSEQVADGIAFFSAFISNTPGSEPIRVCLRDNLIEGTMQFNNAQRFAQITMERNLLLNARALYIPPQVDQYTLRHNLVIGHTGTWFMYDPEGRSRDNRLIIANNVFQVQHSPIWTCPPNNADGATLLPWDVTIQNNVFLSQERKGIDFYRATDRASAAQHWRVGHNVYAREPASPLVASAALTASDRVIAQPLLAVDLAKRNFFRIAADGPLAKGGAGGDLPQYIGIAPPGPAPLSGDWLTRLREAATAEALPALGAVRTYLGHTSGVFRAAFTPGGRHFVTGSADGAICLWQATADDDSEIRTFRHETGSVAGLACSPDGALAISSEGQMWKDGKWQEPRDSTLRLWNLHSGELVGRFVGHAGRVEALRFFPDGKSVLSGGFDGVVARWDVASQKQRQRYEAGAGSVTAVAVSLDGALVAANRGIEVHVWDAVKGTRLSTFRGHHGGPSGISISPDGTLVASTTPDEKAVRVWKPRTGEEVALLEHPHFVWSVAFQPTQPSILLTGCDDGNIYLWDVSSKRVLYRFPGHTPKLGILALALSRDGRFAVSGSDDRSVRLWRLPENYPEIVAKEPRTFTGHEGWVHSAAMIPNSKRLISCGADKSVRIWDLETGEQLHRFDSHKERVWRVAVSPDGRYAASGGGGEAGEQPGTWTLGTDNEIRLWDLNESKEAQRFRGHTDMVYALQFSPDSKRLLSGGGAHDATVRLWDVETGDELHKIDGGDGWITSVAFHPDGNRIAWSGVKRKVCLYDLEAKKLLREFLAHDDEAIGVAFSPDGERLVSAGKDNTIRVWDVATGRELRRLPGHDGDVWMVRFTSDGRRIVSASIDGTARVWDARSGAEQTRFVASSGLWGAILTADESQVLTFGVDGILRLWPLEAESAK